MKIQLDAMYMYDESLELEIINLLGGSSNLTVRQIAAELHIKPFDHQGHYTGTFLKLVTRISDMHSAGMLDYEDCRNSEDIFRVYNLTYLGKWKYAQLKNDALSEA